MRNCFMSLSEYAKVDSENNLSLKQLFYTAGGETFSKFTHKHGIWMETGATKQISSLVQQDRTGLPCRGQFIFQLKINICNFFHSYFTESNKSGSNQFPISTQKPHPKLPQEIGTFQKMVQITLFLQTWFLFASQYRFSWTSVIPFNYNFLILSFWQKDNLRGSENFFANIQDYGLKVPSWSRMLNT